MKAADAHRGKYSSEGMKRDHVKREMKQVLVREGRGESGVVTAISDVLDADREVLP